MAEETKSDATLPAAAGATPAKLTVLPTEPAAPSDGGGGFVPLGKLAPPLAAPPPAAKKEKEHEKPRSPKPEKPTDPSAIVGEESVEIAAPQEAVWRFFLNFVKWPDWNPVCLGTRSLVQGTSFGLGWRFELRLKCGPLKLKFEPTILENTTPQVIRWLGGTLGVYGMHWFIFEKTEAGARVTSYEEFTGPLRWMLYPIRAWIKSMMRTWLGALKAEMEKQAAFDKKSPPLRPVE